MQYNNRIALRLELSKEVSYAYYCTYIESDGVVYPIHTLASEEQVLQMIWKSMDGYVQGKASNRSDLTLSCVEIAMRAILDDLCAAFEADYLVCNTSDDRDALAEYVQQAVSLFAGLSLEYNLSAIDEMLSPTMGIFTTHASHGEKQNESRTGYL